jgi:hypothetical protein
VSEVLRVDPRRLTAVREAYSQALDELRPTLDSLGNVGHINTPWLGDQVSEFVKAEYNAKVMGDRGAYAAMRQYEIELTAIHDHIAEMEKAYLAGESAVAERTPRMA